MKTILEHPSGERSLRVPVFQQAYTRLRIRSNPAPINLILKNFMFEDKMFNLIEAGANVPADMLYAKISKLYEPALLEATLGLDETRAILTRIAEQKILGDKFIYKKHPLEKDPNSTRFPAMYGFVLTAQGIGVFAKCRPLTAYGSGFAAQHTRVKEVTFAFGSQNYLGLVHEVKKHHLFIVGKKR